MNLYEIAKQSDPDGKVARKINERHERFKRVKRFAMIERGWPEDKAIKLAVSSMDNENL